MLLQASCRLFTLMRVCAARVAGTPVGPLSQLSLSQASLVRVQRNVWDLPPDSRAAFG